MEPKIAKRTAPKSVRFEAVSYDRMLKAEGLSTAQQVVDFLMKWYDQNKFPIVVNPVLERNTVVVQNLVDDKNTNRSIDTRSKYQKERFEGKIK